MPASKIATSTPITTYFIRKTDGTNTSIRKISDDLAKKKLSNVEPTDIERRFSIDRKGSVGSDSHWLGWADYRRLSEAGVRRSSDSSIVLTEDTDSFIIGDRVWVGGNKPGQIAYIGETQFAPGDWAGIVLDQPIGKNDGSVGGVRYFQCENKRGIFSRLTRLTRKPLFGFGENEIEKSYVPPTSTSPRPSISSTRSSVSSPTSPVSKISIGGSTVKSNELKVGDRVIVMSSMGSKAGMLRYLGATDFAVGEWCGVELDDPLGKNDGSVAGRRYFDCLPNFGLFAPIHKVSKSPSGNRKPSVATPSCAMHPTGAGYKKHSGSRESLNSTTTTASSIKSTSRRPSSVRTAPVSAAASQNKTPLQDLLHQKQQHIEQLLKERDLERAEVTRAASQAEQAEHELAVMKQDFIQFKEETAAKSNDYELLINQLQIEKKELSNILEDERRRYEDLQFRYEEESITRADLEARLTKSEEKLKELDNQDRLNQETLETESNKLFEAEEALTKIKDEYEALRLKLTEVERQSLTSNKEYQTQTESKLLAQTNLLESQTKELEEYKTKFKELVDKNNELIQTIGELRKELESSNENYQISKNKLNDELDRVKSEFEESENKCKDFEENSIKLANEINEYKINIDKQTADNLFHKKAIVELQEKAKKSIEEKDEIISKLQKDKDNELQELKSQLVNQQVTFSNKEQELVNQLKDLLSENELLKNDKIVLENTYVEKIKILDSNFSEVNLKLLEIEKEKDGYKNTVDSLNLRLKDFQNEQTKMEERYTAQENKLKAEINTLQSSFKDSNEDYETRNQKVLNELKSKESQLVEINESLEKFQTENHSLKEKLESVAKENTALTNQLTLFSESSKKKEEEAESEKMKLMKDISAKEDSIKDLEHMVESFEIQIKELKDNQSSSNKQINDFELKVGDLTSQLSNASDKCSQLSAYKLKLEDDIATLMNNSSDSSSQLSKLNDELRAKENEIGKLRESLNEQTRVAKNNEQQMKQQYDEVAKKLDESNKTMLNIENELKGKVENYNKLKNEYEILSECEKLSSTKLKSIEKEYEEMVKKLKQKDEEQEALVSKLESAKEIERKIIKENEGNVNNANKIENELRATIEIIEADSKKHKKEIDNLLNDKIILEERLKTRENILLEKDKQLNEFVQLNDKSREDFLNEKKVLDDKIVDLTNKIKSSNEILNKKNSEITEISNERDLIKDEKSSINNQLHEANNKLSNVTHELDKVKGDLLKSEEKYNEIASKLSDDSSKLLKEKEELSNLFKSKELELNSKLVEIEKLKEEKIIFEKNIHEKDYIINDQKKNFDILTNDITTLKEELKEMNSEKTNLEEKLKFLSNEIEKHSQNEISLIDNSNKELSKLKDENTTLVLRLKDLEKTFSSQDEKVVKQLDEEKQKTGELNEKLAQSELQKEQLKNSVSRLHESLKENDETKTSLQCTVDNFQKILGDKEKQISSLQSEINKLIVEKDLNVQNKKYTESLEKEKKVLEEKVTKLQSQPVNSNNPSSSNNNSGPVPNLTGAVSAGVGGLPEKQNEETEMLHGQINFLNSIIVDLQNKNDVLQTRIVQLETGEPDPTSLNGIKTRTVAPRLFCDICDVFDAHDTEDCPTQSSSSPVPEQKHSYPRGYVRPYCENCEMFGHETGNCEEDETF